MTNHIKEEEGKSIFQIPKDIDELPPELRGSGRIQGILAWQRDHQVPVTVAISGGTKPPGIVILNVGNAFKAADPASR